MNFIIIFPEIILFVGALIILMLDIFLGKYLKNFAPRIAFIGSIVFSIASLTSVIINSGVYASSFEYMVSINPFISLVKTIVVLLLITVLFISGNFIQSEKRISAEFVALTMIATSGSLLLLSANDLLAFYMALELQSLPLYILAAIKRDSSKSSEAGIKYFILGAVASGILLLGISFVYGFYGSTNIGQIISGVKNGSASIGLLFGFILIMTAMFFKSSAAPFHMWTPDVYEGSTTVVTSFFASVIKVVSVFVLLRIYISIIGIWPNINQILIIVSILSLLIGSLGAIKQTNLKRLLAYSSIGHVGFITAGILTGGFEGIKSVILYMAIYGTLTVGSFAFLILLKNQNPLSNDPDKQNDDTYDISSLALIARKSPIAAMSMAVIMFSMAGIPPLAGFFAKFYILIAVVKQELYTLAIIAVITSVISAFYYLRIIKIMYFDNKEKSNIQIDSNNNALLVLIVAALINLLLFIFLKPLLSIIDNVF